MCRGGSVHEVADVRDSPLLERLLEPSAKFTDRQLFEAVGFASRRRCRLGVVWTEMGVDPVVDGDAFG